MPGTFPAPCPCLEVQLWFSTRCPLQLLLGNLHAPMPPTKPCWCSQRGESARPLSRGVQRDGQGVGYLDPVSALAGAGMQLGLAPPVASPPQGSPVGMAAMAQSWLLQDSHCAKSSSSPALNEVKKPPNSCLQQSHRVCIGPPMPTKGKPQGGQRELWGPRLGATDTSCFSKRHHRPAEVQKPALRLHTNQDEVPRGLAVGGSAAPTRSRGRGAGLWHTAPGSPCHQSTGAELPAASGHRPRDSAQGT